MTEPGPWRDYARSRAVLIGAWDYTQLQPVLAARTSLNRMTKLLTDRLCGWPPGRVAKLPNIDRRGHLPDRLMELFDGITDVALFYFVGHGQLHGDDLCLALRESPQTGPRRLTTGLPFSDVRTALRECNARTKIVILDCCFSGNATLPEHTLAAMTAETVDVIEKASGTGAFTMTASGAYQTAGHEPGQTARAQTYFTKYFIDVIEQGDPDHPEGLPLRVIYDRTAHALARDGRPVPARSVRDNADKFILARNATGSFSAPAKRLTSRRPGPTGSAAETTIGAATGNRVQLSPTTFARHDRDQRPAGRLARSIPTAVDPAAVVRIWPELLRRLGERDKPTLVLMQNAVVRSVEGDTLVLSMPTAGLARQLSQEPRADRVRTALRELVPGEWQIRCVHGEASPPAENYPATSAATTRVTEPSVAAASAATAIASSVLRTPATVDRVAVDRIWPELLRRVGERSKPTLVLLQNAVVQALDSDRLVLSMPTAGLARQLSQEPRAERIRTALRELIPGVWPVRPVDDATAPPGMSTTLSFERRVTVDTVTMHETWPELLRWVGERSRPTLVLLQNAKVRAVEGDTLALSMPTAGLARQLSQESRADVIRATLCELFHGDWQIRFMHGDTVLLPADSSDIRAE